MIKGILGIDTPFLSWHRTRLVSYGAISMYPSGGLISSDIANFDDISGTTASGNVTFSGAGAVFAGGVTSGVRIAGLTIPAGNWWAHSVVNEFITGTNKMRGRSVTYDPLDLRPRGFHQVYKLPNLSSSSEIEYLASSNFNSTLERVQLYDQTDALANPWDIWILAGQSNMACTTSGLPLDKHEDAWSDQRLMYFPGATFSGTQSQIDTIDAARGPLVAAGIINDAFQVNPANIGVTPGLRFGQRVVQTTPEGRSVVLVQTAISGTGLEGAGAAWNPAGNTGEGALAYDAMVARVAAALAAAPTGSLIKGVIWAQGEGDTSADMASYPESWATMRAAAELAFGQGQLPWVILLGPPSATRRNQDEFRRVQTAMASVGLGPEAQANCYAVDRPTGYMEDSTHVTAAGNRIAGEHLAVWHLESAYEDIPLYPAGGLISLAKSNFDDLTGTTVTTGVTLSNSGAVFDGAAPGRVTFGGLTIPAGNWWAHAIINDFNTGGNRMRGLSPTYNPLPSRGRGKHQVYQLPALSGSTSLDFLSSTGFTSTVEHVQLYDQTDALAAPWDIWIAAGQSNMAATTAGLPVDNIEDAWTDQRLMYFPGGSSTALDTTVDSIDAARGPLAAASIVNGSGSLSNDPFTNGISPILRFGQRIVQSTPADRSVVLIQTAISGTSLEGAGAAWNPDGSTGDGALAYDAMVARVAAALSQAPAGSTIKGVVWAQGEGDSSADMSSYPASWATMRSAAETAFGQGQLPWTILLGPPDASRPNQDEFRRVQTAMATGSGGVEEQPNCHVVDRPTGYMEDSTHVTAAGNRIAGERLASWYLNTK
jgi:hypothetical protein